MTKRRRKQPHELRRASVQRATLRELLGPSAREYAEGRMRIPADALLRIEWPSDPGQFHVWYFTVAEHFRHTYPRGKLEVKRLASLHISSYAEIGSFGASHWYATIRADVGVATKPGTGSGCSGYLGRANPREWTEGIKVEVRRPIKSGERDALGDRIGRAGELTRRLNSKKEAIRLAIETFKHRFGPGWLLVDERNDDEIVAET